MSGSEKDTIHAAVTANAAQEGEGKHHPFKKDPEMGSGFCFCYLDVVPHNSPPHGSPFGCFLMSMSRKSFGQVPFPDDAQNTMKVTKEPQVTSAYHWCHLSLAERGGCLLSLAECKACFQQHNERTPLKAPQHIPHSSPQDTE